MGIARRNTVAPIALLLAGTVALPGFADGASGTLDAFRTSAGQTAASGTGNGDTAAHALDFLAETFGELLAVSFVYGGVCSWSRTAGGPAQAGEPAPREPGEPLIPLLRADATVQRVAPDITARALRLEAGYGPLGAHYDVSRYRETDPDDTLELHRVFGLYRMSFGPHAELDLGFGTFSMDGLDRSPDFAFTLPLRVVPVRHLALEFRPAWSDGAADYDLAVLATAPFAAFKAGYRWTLSPDATLNGPYVGIALCW
jgi:hypothetical protein